VTLTAPPSSDTPTPVKPALVVVSFLVDVTCIVLFVILGRRNHHETGSFVEATLKVAAPFLIALAVGWVVARGWRNPTGLGTVAVVWVVTIALGMVLRNLVFDRGTASAFVIVAAVVTFVLLFGWRLLYNKVLARTS
jgi:hypothetical protein